MPKFSAVKRAFAVYATGVNKEETIAALGCTLTRFSAAEAIGALAVQAAYVQSVATAIAIGTRIAEFDTRRALPAVTTVVVAAALVAACARSPLCQAVGAHVVDAGAGAAMRVVFAPVAVAAASEQSPIE